MRFSDRFTKSLLGMLEDFRYELNTCVRTPGAILLRLVSFDFDVVKIKAEFDTLDEVAEDVAEVFPTIGILRYNLAY